jgi:hypothetical protein
LDQTVEKLRLPVLLGTNRKLRKGEFVAESTLGQSEKRSDIERRLFDVAQFALPQDNYGKELKQLLPWPLMLVQQYPVFEKFCAGLWGSLFVLGM